MNRIWVPIVYCKAVRTSAIQLQYKKNVLYCICVVVVLHLCGPLKEGFVTQEGFSLERKIE